MQFCLFLVKRIYESDLSNYRHFSKELFDNVTRIFLDTDEKICYLYDGEINNTEVR